MNDERKDKIAILTVMGRIDRRWKDVQRVKDMDKKSDRAKEYGQRDRGVARGIGQWTPSLCLLIFSTPAPKDVFR